MGQPTGPEWASRALKPCHPRYHGLEFDPDTSTMSTHVSVNDQIGVLLRIEQARDLVSILGKLQGG
jgi:hypothetical protein